MSITKLDCVELKDTRYSVYPYDGYNLEEILGKFYEAIKECNDLSFSLQEFNTWLIDEGLIKEVEKQLSKVNWDNIVNSELYQQVVNRLEEIEKSVNSSDVIVSKLPNYDKNDISILLNSLEFESGKTYILDDGEVRSKEKLVLNLPSRCNLHILSKVLCENDFMTINFPTQNNDGNNLIINCVEYVGQQSQTDTKVALEMKKGANVNVDIGVIKGFGYGLYLLCNENDEWIQYCNFKFREIKVSQKGITLIVNNSHNWINENNFYGGGLSGINNIYMEKRGGDGSLINSNRFHDLGVYTDGTEIIYINDVGCQSNSFYNLRLWEQSWNVEKPFIYDKGNKNYFSSKYMIPINALVLGNNSVYEGDIHSSVYDIDLQSYPLITDRMRMTEKGLPTYRRFYEYEEGKKFNGRRKIYKFVDTIFCGLAENETLYLDIMPHLCQKGVTFFVRINGSTGSNLIIELPTGKQVNIASSGLFKCNMIQPDWCEVYKINDGSVMYPV